MFAVIPLALAAVLFACFSFLEKPPNALKPSKENPLYDESDRDTNCPFWSSLFKTLIYTVSFLIDQLFKNNEYDVHIGRIESFTKLLYRYFAVVYVLQFIFKVFCRMAGKGFRALHFYRRWTFSEGEHQKIALLREISFTTVDIIAHIAGLGFAVALTLTDNRWFVAVLDWMLLVYYVWVFRIPTFWLAFIVTFFLCIADPLATFVFHWPKIDPFVTPTHFNLLWVAAPLSALQGSYIGLCLRFDLYLFHRKEKCEFHNLQSYACPYFVAALVSYTVGLTASVCTIFYGAPALYFTYSLPALALSTLTVAYFRGEANILWKYLDLVGQWDLRTLFRKKNKEKKPTLVYN